eukprot:1180683-Prorocentrum_minimum.AAC.2
MNMTRTLESFETEWYELAQTGQLHEEDVGAVPDIYLRNHELDSMTKALRAELEHVKSIAGKATATWDKFRKERDFHRMHHKRVGQCCWDLRWLENHICSIGSLSDPLGQSARVPPISRGVV